MQNVNTNIIAPGNKLARCEAAANGWVECPERYDASEITEACIAHDSAIRALTADEAEALEEAERAAI